jgi:hypothetical protein
MEPRTAVGPAGLGRIARQERAGLHHGFVRNAGHGKKALLRHETEGNRHIYVPRVKQSEVLGLFLKNMVSTLFGGSAANAMQHLLQTAPVSETEIREMRVLLEDYTQRKGIKHHD